MLLTNCYAIKQDGLNLAYKGTNATTEECDLKSSADMQSAEFAATLGSAFQYNGGGYPTLKRPGASGGKERRVYFRKVG